MPFNLGPVCTAGEAHRLEAALDGVAGWLHLDEATALYRAAVSLPDPEDGNPTLIVEIGSYQGRSAIAMALALGERGHGRLVAIDQTLQPELNANLNKAGVAHLVTVMSARSSEARMAIIDKSVDMIFVDGGHDYVDVAQDIDMWRSALKPRAVVAFNDTSMPGVYRAVSERVLTPMSPYRRPKLVRSTLIVDYRPDAAWTTDDLIALNRLRFAMRVRRDAGRVVSRMPRGLKVLGNKVSRAIVGGDL